VLARWARHLDNSHTSPLKQRAECAAVRARALDRDCGHTAVLECSCHLPLVPGWRRWNADVVAAATQVINRDGDVNQIVGVDANDNLLCQAFAGHLFLRMGGSAASGRTDL